MSYDFHFESVQAMPCRECGMGSRYRVSTSLGYEYAAYACAAHLSSILDSVIKMASLNVTVSHAVHEQRGEMNYTYNVSGMFRLALGMTMSDMHGMPTEKAAPILERALSVFTERRAEMDALAPENGWGDAAGAYEVLDWLHEMCITCPGFVMLVY